MVKGFLRDSFSPFSSNSIRTSINSSLLAPLLFRIRPLSPVFVDLACLALLQEEIQELAAQEARVDQLISHVKDQLRKLVSAGDGVDAWGLDAFASLSLCSSVICEDTVACAFDVVLSRARRAAVDECVLGDDGTWREWTLGACEHPSEGHRVWPRVP